MAKLKLKLDMEPAPDAAVIGISSHVNDHKLCWAINLHLGWALSRRREDIVAGNAGASFAAFDHFDHEGRVQYSLVSNRCGSGILVREQARTDFFLVADEEAPMDHSELLAAMRATDLVLAAFTLDLLSLSAGQELLPPPTWPRTQRPRS